MSLWQLEKLCNQDEEWKSIIWKLPESPVFSGWRQTEREREQNNEELTEKHMFYVFECAFMPP